VADGSGAAWRVRQSIAALPRTRTEGRKIYALVGEAVVVKVDLLDALLECGDNGVERAQAVLVQLAAGVALVDRQYGVVAARPTVSIRDANEVGGKPKLTG
jgi:hypothetical protein